MRVRNTNKGRVRAAFLTAFTVCFVAGVALAQAVPSQFCLWDEAGATCDLFLQKRLPVAAPVPAYCYEQPATCVVTNNLLVSPEDLSANGTWIPQGASGTPAPIVTAMYDADPAGGRSAARVEFAAVTAGKESTLWQTLAGACNGITCRYSLFIRSTPNGAGPSTGNLPVATASNGGDGFQPTNCAFTTSWSRCDFAVANAGSFSAFWIGYASYGAGYSGNGPAMDLEIWMPSVILGSTSATYACTTTSQEQLSTGGFTNALVTADWGIAGRDGAGLVTTADNTQVLLGGWNGIPQGTWGGRATTNQVLKSTNGGASWTEVLAHVDDPAQTSADGGQDLDGGQRWRRRHSFGAMLVGGYIYIIGGDALDTSYNAGNPAGPFAREVWRSPAATYGEHWERMCGGLIDGSAPACEWGSRVGMLVWNIGTTLYVAGGQTDVEDPDTALNDVWRSTDDGRTWVSLGNAPWPARGFISNALPTFNGKVWLTGGLRYAADLEDRVHYNDVWSFDGTTWTEMLACAPWEPRGYLNSVAFDGYLWVIRGAYQAQMYGDAWRSTDGLAWSRFPGTVADEGHAGSVTVSVDGGVLSIEGDALAGEKKVWSLTAP